MTDTELDHTYTTLCRTLTHVGEAQSPLYLARLALLALQALDDEARALALIEAAAAGLQPGGQA